MTGVGKIFLSSILQGLLQWFLPYLLDELKKFDHDLAGEVEKLSGSLSSIKSFLERVDLFYTTKHGYIVLKMLFTKPMISLMELKVKCFDNVSLNSSLS